MSELEVLRRARKSDAAFRTISEVATDLDVPQHVLRFWETKFPQVRPLKRGGGRRYYRPEDVVLLRRVRELLYSEGYTIKGVQRLLKDARDAARDARDDDVPRARPLLVVASPAAAQAVELAPAPGPGATEEGPTLTIGGGGPAILEPRGLPAAMKAELAALREELAGLRALLKSED
ncbi:MAG: MerR family transcriptional regulator [Alphaproteobacteria bacterium]